VVGVEPADAFRQWLIGRIEASRESGAANPQSSNPQSSIGNPQSSIGDPQSGIRNPQSR